MSRIIVTRRTVTADRRVSLLKAIHHQDKYEVELSAPCIVQSCTYEDKITGVCELQNSQLHQILPYESSSPKHLRTLNTIRFDCESRRDSSFF